MVSHAQGTDRGGVVLKMRGKDWRVTQINSMVFGFSMLNGVQLPTPQPRGAFNRVNLQVAVYDICRPPVPIMAIVFASDIPWPFRSQRFSPIMGRGVANYWIYGIRPQDPRLHAQYAPEKVKSTRKYPWIGGAVSRSCAHPIYSTAPW